jgi:hypothetical protein
MSVKNKVLPITINSISAGTFNNTFQLLSPASGIPQSLIMIRLINDTTVGVFISYDGVNEHDFVAAATNLTIQFQTNSQQQNQVCCLAQGTKIYVRSSVGTGTFFLGGFYQPQA